ncbi:MAG: hypothetical protein NTZ74_03435 [Chloroflexi bacterium]|nr:hypothetical protein [Chloroflexota bacterium]
MDTNVKKIAADVGFDAFKVSAIIDTGIPRRYKITPFFSTGEVF